MRTPHTYRVTYGIRHGIKQYYWMQTMEIDCFNKKEAIRITKDEVQRIFGKYAFHCKAERIIYK